MVQADEEGAGGDDVETGGDVENIVEVFGFGEGENDEDDGREEDDKFFRPPLPPVPSGGEEGERSGDEEGEGDVEEIEDVGLLCDHEEAH